jgi:hypothetical protein
VPNGQEVMKIVAWKGCDNPDSFVANESVWKQHHCTTRDS